MLALFVKISGIWYFQGYNILKVDVEEFKRNVRSDAELTKDMPVKTEGYKIVNLDNDEVDSWLFATKVRDLYPVNPLPGTPEVSDSSEKDAFFPLSASALVPGHKYWVAHKSDTQRKTHESVMVYLGTAEDGTLQWDARPASGTQQMPASWFIGAKEVNREFAPFVNQVLRSR